MNLWLDRRSALASGLATGTLLSAAPSSGVGHETTEFFSLIRANGPHPSLGRHAETFDRLSGDWRGDYVQMPPDKAPVTGRMEFHQGWVLDGRAVQDVFIFSQPGAPPGGRVLPATAATFGTSIRYCDPATGLWQVRWIDPGNKQIEQLVAKRVGDDIVQIGAKDGITTKWVFSDISPRSFTWRNHQLDRDGKTWVQREEYHLRRM